MNALEVQHVTKRFGGITALDRCSFSVEQGSIVSIIGPNGAGKTTLFNIISGFYAPDEGRVLLRDTDVTDEPAYQRTRSGLTRTFQAVRLFQNMSVLANLLVASKHMRSGLTAAILGVPSWRETEEQDKKRAMELLKTVHLEDKAAVLTKHLSYGQRKLVEILRALMSDPDTLILDEPAAGVNRTTLQTIQTLITDLHAQGKTIVLVEHDMHFVMSLSERIIVLDYGEVIAEGTPTEVQNNPKVVEAYLGKKS